MMIEVMPWLELDQQTQQSVAVGLVEAGGRLVEDQQLDLLGERLGDLDQLLLADAQIGDERVGQFLEANLRQEVARAAERHAPVDDAHPGGLVAEEDVFGDRQQRHERQFLMDDDDAEMLAVGDARKAAFLALKDDLPLVGAVGVDAAQDFHQGRLAGAVLAADRVDLAFARRRD